MDDGHTPEQDDGEGEEEPLGSGIPARGEMEELRAELRKQGVEPEDFMNSEAVPVWEAHLEHFDADLVETYRVAGDAVALSLTELGFGGPSLDRMEIRPMPRHTIAAISATRGDGAPLILLSHTLLAMLLLYSRHLAAASWAEEGPVRGAFAAAVRHLRGVSGIDGELLASSLRFAALHLRLKWGPVVPHLLLEEHCEGHANLQATHALRFVLAHEVAHTVLGHVPAAGAASPHSEPEREREADRLALRAVMHAQRRENLGGRLHALLGALAAVTVIDFDERALFVHRGASHPPARRRIADLMAGLPAGQASVLQRYTHHLLDVTARASDFSPGADAVSVETAITDPRNLQHPLTDRYRDDLLEKAEIQTTAPAEQIRRIRRWDLRHGTDLTPGAEAVLAGDVDRGLLLWGVREDHVAPMTDPALPLPFARLLTCVHKAMGEGPLEPALRAATLTAHQLTSTEQEGA
ncbi:MULTISPECIES: hypothetical protein [unclassified Nocardiopsis]|uniref:hypothetical protein n=1 Tax=Nocardiopsis TaxID=2013 RepID=UPI00387B02B6